MNLRPIVSKTHLSYPISFDFIPKSFAIRTHVSLFIDFYSKNFNCKISIQEIGGGIIFFSDNKDRTIILKMYDLHSIIKANSIGAWGLDQLFSCSPSCRLFLYSPNGQIIEMFMPRFITTFYDTIKNSRIKLESLINRIEKFALQGIQIDFKVRDVFYSIPMLCDYWDNADFCLNIIDIWDYYGPNLGYKKKYSNLIELNQEKWCQYRKNLGLENHPLDPNEEVKAKGGYD